MKGYGGTECSNNHCSMVWLPEKTKIMTSKDNNKPQNQETVRIKDDNQNIIEGNLTMPSSSQTTTTSTSADIKGIVLFAHGSGSSRYSQRNQYVAQVLNDAGIGTLLIDLLTPEEEGLMISQESIDLTLNYLPNDSWLQRTGYYIVLDLKI
jgi:hypothetical protein